jgi:hypothetical protein
MPEMELAIVSETKATIAKPKMTTTTRNSLQKTQKGRAGRLPNSRLCIINRIGLREYEIL